MREAKATGSFLILIVVLLLLLLFILHELIVTTHIIEIYHDLDALVDLVSGSNLLGLAGELGGVAALRVNRLLFRHKFQRCTALGHDLLERFLEVLVQVDEILLKSLTFLMVQFCKEELDAILSSHQAI